MLSAFFTLAAFVNKTEQLEQYEQDCSDWKREQSKKRIAENQKKYEEELANPKENEWECFWKRPEY